MAMTNAQSTTVPVDRIVRINEGLRIWARALGCSPGQVADVVARAGLPIEKLWNSLNVAPGASRVN
jgi:hypothetical protein